MKSVVIAQENDVELQLDSALLFYRSQGTNHIYATQHAARVVDGRPTLLAGVPITLDQLADIADLAAQKTSYRGFVHDRVVYLAPNMIAWWVPAGTRHVWFKTTDKIGERAGDAKHPPLLFIVNRNDWSVFALRENERPGAATRLYTAPYYNVWEDGSICVGNVPTPERIGMESIAPFEDAFFRSRFTHPNNKRLIHRRGGAQHLWLDLLDGADFPLDRLIDAKQTLAEAISTNANED
ncbi:PRTRC system protein B [Paraburkholderia sp. BL21I4N1]|uniref:PRTRC system protein B n=1 Tax=Paraburkholderia sp. BL21I4N1 TaxID=1938801 RepID=UPI000CFD3C1A|nr:PRTRC system protein B [Paraburkholderia sp. BL21I4N1]PQV51013.1 PRTRC genetic system protein B [Paraburkholderia sp. BL21I4N1]